MYRKYRHQAFFSQNFLRRPELVQKLIRHSSLGKNDLVIEVGPGRGIITKELVKTTGLVLAVERDEKLYKRLISLYRNIRAIRVYRVDFLRFRLPQRPFKVFANIPFSVTADIMRKLTNDENFKEGYLVVQKEFAKKILGMPYATKNSMQSVLLKPFFEFEIFWRFKRSDFSPTPNVDIVMIHICRKYIPQVSLKDTFLYRDFVTYLFNKGKVAKKDIKEILKMFEYYSKSSSLQEKRIVKNFAWKVRGEQRNLQKVHRTRKDKNWKRFKIKY